MPHNTDASDAGAVGVPSIFNFPGCCNKRQFVGTMSQREN